MSARLYRATLEECVRYGWNARTVLSDGRRVLPPIGGGAGPADAVANFAYSTVATAPSPATSGTSLVVASGDGSKFPTAPSNVVIWPAGANPLTSNAEIARVTAVSTDTFTITRAQEGSSARTVVVGDQIMAAITAKTLTDRNPDTHMRVTGDVTGTTAFNVTGLSFAIGANEIWTAEFFLVGTGSVNGMEFAFTGPASPTNVEAGIMQASKSAALAAFSTFTSGNKFLNSTTLPVRITLCVENGANAGTVQLQCQQATATETQTIKRGSYGNARKVS